MDELESHFALLHDDWHSAREQLDNNPQILRQHMPEVELSDIDFIIELIHDWASKFPKPSKRQKNAYHLSLGLFKIDIQAAQTRLRQFNSGQHAQIRAFTEHLFKCASHLNSMAALNADLDQELTHALSSSVISAVQELDRALSDVNKIYEMSDDIKELHNSLSEMDTSARGTLQQIEEALAATKEHANAANEAHDETRSHAAQASDIIEQLETHKANYETLLTTTQELRQTLGELVESAQQHDRTVQDLLPRATSAGLASAFEQKARDMWLPKVMWFAAFAGSIAGLLVVGFYFGDAIFTDDPLASLVAIAQRAPLIAPLVWLGWFSARQYGHVDRLQEDYTYKKTISQAFEGYKAQMEELGDSNAVLKRLCDQTITILAKDPMRSYSRKPDEAPSSSLFGGVFGKQSERHEEGK